MITLLAAHLHKHWRFYTPLLIIIFGMQTTASSQSIFNHAKGTGGAVNGISMTVKNFGAFTNIPVPPAGTIAHYIGVDSGATNSRVTFEVYNNAGVAGAALTTRRARGQYNAPSALNRNDIIGVLNAMPYKATRFNATSTASVALRMDEDATNTSAGSYIDFLTTNNGDTSNTSKMRIRNDGKVQINTLVNAGTLAIGSDSSIRSATAADLNTTYGFTPYNSTNPSGYITASAITGKLDNTLTSGRIFVGNGSNVATGVALSGDATMANTGAMALNTVNSNVGTFDGPYTVNAKGLITAALNTSINDAPGRSLVTTTSSTGFQVSSTRNALVSYEGTFQTTSTIGGPSSITVFLETANTNSTTPSDWTTIASQTNSNTITLAVVLQQVDIEPWSITRTIPAGKFVRIRYGNISGTATATINSAQQEVTN